MIISLIFVVVSLSTIDADRYHPSLNTKQPKGLDTRTNVKPHITQIKFCNKLWNSAKILPESAQITFQSLMGALVKDSYLLGYFLDKSFVQRSLVYSVNRVQKRLKKDKNHKQKNPKMSPIFMNLCMTMWDLILDYTTPCQARIGTNLLGILEGAKYNLENNESPFPENILPSTVYDPESEYEELEDFRRKIEDLPSWESVFPIDDRCDDPGYENGENV